MSTMHAFKTSLLSSHRASDWPGWEPLYRQAFHGFKQMIDFREDGAHQRAGIDRMIVLANTNTVFVDEKVRGRNQETGRVYRDIFLETVSNASTNAPGWVVKPLRADYIAYLIGPLGICHLLPLLQLQAAWLRCGRGWTGRFGEREALNEGYVTRGVPVPVDVLYPAISSAHHVSFKPFEPFVE